MLVSKRAEEEHWEPNVVHPIATTHLGLRGLAAGPEAGTERGSEVSVVPVNQTLPSSGILDMAPRDHALKVRDGTNGAWPGAPPHARDGSLPVPPILVVALGVTLAASLRTQRRR